MAVEHSTLSKELGEDFNLRTARRLGELSVVTRALKEWEDANNVRRNIHNHLYWGFG
jgi:peptide chain release factor 1